MTQKQVKIKWFKGVSTLEELKKEYRKAAMQHHPDRGGSVEDMQSINAEYDYLFQILKEQHNVNAKEEYQKTTEAPEEFRYIIEQLLKMGDDIAIELCGSWIWISGDTRTHKDELKAAGCFLGQY